VNASAGFAFKRRARAFLAFVGRRYRRAIGQRVVAAVGVAILLTQCTVGPDFRVPDLPSAANYGGSRGAATPEQPARPLAFGGNIPERWWQLFRSRYLNELIEQAIAHNPDLEAAEAAVRIAQANALTQRVALFPTVAAGFSPSYQRFPTGELTSPLNSGADIFALYTPQVSVSYVPDVFGGTRRQIEVADALVDVQVFQREGVYLALVGNIALAAIEEASLRGQLEATRRLIELQAQLLQIMRRQHDVGDIALPDLVAQETAHAQAMLILPPIEKRLAQQRDLLATLVGRFPGEDLAASFQLGSFRLPRKLPLSVPADLVRQRPDVRVAEAELHAANAQIGVAIANRLPQITLTGNAGSTATAISQLFSPGTLLWMVAGNAAQTVFDAGALENKQRAAERAFDQMTAQYRRVVLTAFRNVADTLRALEADNSAVSAADAAEKSAARNMELTRGQVQQGQVVVPVLLLAQQAYLQTAIAHVQAEAALLADAVALFQALGGGWWTRRP